MLTKRIAASGNEIVILLFCEFCGVVVAVAVVVYRRVHALECIMGNQGKMERNSQVCVEVQYDEKYS